jgi:hypothetical protein
MRIFVLTLLLFSAGPLFAEFKAGSAIVDVSPTTLPVISNGSMTSRLADKIKTPLNARSLAFSDGNETLVIVVVDSCMMPRPLLDEVKEIASKKGGISPDRILISATHTHTAGSCMGALGTDADPVYTLLLKKKLVEAVLAPLKEMKPAQIGWGEVDAGKFTALRRWVMRPDRMTEDPFGNLTGRANMHAGANWDNVTGKSGPEDPMLRMISVQTTDGKPIGLLCNFSMHYFGDRDISADYFGLFSNALQEQIAPESGFVAMMSHGCSGDIWRHDYEASSDRKDPNQQWTIEEYSRQLSDLALTAYADIEYEKPDSIAMEETRMNLKYRLPDKQRLEWARTIVDAMGDRLPKTKEEVYAREQIILDERQETEIVVQGLRLGQNISIATTPNETYALTGLKIIHASPTPHTMVIELANGGDGYIPPPEQHLLGGYNTWAARSAGLEVEAEPKIAEAAIQLLESVTAKSRLPDLPPASEASAAILAQKPRAYYRLDETAGPVAFDESPNHLNALYEPQVLFYLRGPENFDKGMHWNRSVHLAGDRVRADIPNLGNDYRIALWFWNGMPASAREETGWILSRGRNHTLGDEGDHLGIGGTSGNAGTLIFFHGDESAEVAAGKTPIERWKWHHLELKRVGKKVTVHLDGKLEIETTAPAGFPADLHTIFFGGRCDGKNNFEGRLDEIAVFTAE